MRVAFEDVKAFFEEKLLEERDIFLLAFTFNIALAKIADRR